MSVVVYVHGTNHIAGHSSSMLDAYVHAFERMIPVLQEFPLNKESDI